MSPRLRTALLVAGIALNVHAILRARRIVADALNLDGDPDDGCGASWCPCRYQPDDEGDCDGETLARPTAADAEYWLQRAREGGLARRPVAFDELCGDVTKLGGGYTCVKPAGHPGLLHSGGGYSWTTNLRRAL